MSALRATCPTCKRPIEWSEAFPFRPFCSDRCRLIDLNGWLSEQHVIAGSAPIDGGETSAITDEE
jgi:uncharacterized protein